MVTPANTVGTPTGALGMSTARARIQQELSSTAFAQWLNANHGAPTTPWGMYHARLYISHRMTSICNLPLQSEVEKVEYAYAELAQSGWVPDRMRDLERARFAPTVDTTPRVASTARTAIIADDEGKVSTPPVKGTRPDAGGSANPTNGTGAQTAASYASDPPPAGSAASGGIDPPATGTNAAGASGQDPWVAAAAGLQAALATWAPAVVAADAKATSAQPAKNGYDRDPGPPPIESGTGVYATANSSGPVEGQSAQRGGGNTPEQASSQGTAQLLKWAGIAWAAFSVLKGV